MIFHYRFGDFEVSDIEVADKLVDLIFNDVYKDIPKFKKREYLVKDMLLTLINKGSSPSFEPFIAEYESELVNMYESTAFEELCPEVAETEQEYSNEFDRSKLEKEGE